MKKRLGATAVVVAAVAAAAGLPTAAAVSAASAKSGGQVRLSVLPLPESSLGSAAQRLRLEHDSGVHSHWAGLGLPVFPNHSGVGVECCLLQKLGRISGYALDYGLGASGGAGITEVWTSVDQYRTIVGAKKGLAAWQRVDHDASDFGKLAIAIKAEKVESVGSGRFAFLVRYKAANIAPLVGFDEQFTRGSYQADVTVWAGTAATAERLAAKLARKLDARIKLALAGRLDAKPVNLPPRQKTSRPPGSPDLSPLALSPTDLGVQVSSWDHGYGFNDGLFAVSSYFDGMGAGRTTSDVGFVAFQQDIDWFATANQASFTADSAEGPPFGGGVSVDLSSVGDGAWGVLYRNEADFVFSSGRLVEQVKFDRHAPFSTSEELTIAQTLASKINAAGLGG
jgi:hypothetical protein